MTQKVVKLENGIRLVTEDMPGILSATVGVYVGRGARHEAQEQNGIAHFLEHMAFKGTKKRSALDIAEEIENIGGYMNAYTSKDITAYYTRLLGEDVPLALDVLSDIMLHPSFDKGEIETERGVILQEIGQTNDTPDDVIFDWLSEESFPNQALGRPILGAPDNVRRFQDDDFREFVGTQYGPENLVIAAAGHIDHDAVEAMVREYFADIDYQSGKAQEEVKFRSGQKRVEKDLEQAHIAMALPAPSLGDDDFYAAQLMSNILGGGMSSRLFQNIREKRGLCYTIFASLQAMRDAGQLMIYSGTSAQGIDELMEQTALELKRFSSTLNEAELARAKAQLRAGSVMALENVSSRVERMARQMIFYDKLIPMEETLAKIDAVSLQDIADLAERTLCQEPQMVLYGQIGKARDFDGYMAGIK